MPTFGVGVLGWPVGDSMVAGLAGKLVSQFTSQGQFTMRSLGQRQIS